MKKLLLCLLTLGCMTSVASHQFIESRTRLCSELWQDVKTIVIGHPYATAIVVTALIGFIFWYSKDDQDFEYVSNYKDSARPMHVLIPARVKRPENFWQKSKLIESGSEL